MDNSRTRVRWRDAGFWHYFGHGERDGARIQEDTVEKEETKKTVCQDDEFVYRGANPRTGIVSPFVFGEGSENVWHDFEKPAGKPDQGRVEDCPGYRQVANVPLIPITQGFDEGPSCTKFSKILQHTIVSDSINSDPTSVGDEKIQENPSNLTDVSKAPNGVERRTPIITLTPPTTELQHIRRKKVGSGHVPRVAATNSKSCENLQDSAMKVLTNDNAFGTTPFSSIEPRRGFLTAEADDLNGHLKKSADTRNFITTSAASNPTSAVSEKYIARPHFLQSAINASQPTSYHRSGQLLAKSPRSIDSRGNRRNMNNASPADTSCKPWKSEQRPQVYRKCGTTSIPTVDSYESHLDEGCKYFLSLTSQGIESITEQSTKLDRINTTLQHFNRNQCVMPSLERERQKVPAMGSVSKTILINK